ncbi:MAG: hypothetical protein ABIO55_01500 [Ginsengibacter sp.]
MKPKYSNRLALLTSSVLFAAILFTSCSKEEIFANIENKATTGATAKVQTADAAAVASKSISTLPASPIFTGATPFIAPASQSLTVIVVKKNTYLELYYRVKGSHGNPQFILISYGNEYLASMVFSAYPDFEYFVRMSWTTEPLAVWPSMGSLTLSTSYAVSVKGNSFSSMAVFCIIPT